LEPAIWHLADSLVNCWFPVSWLAPSLIAGSWGTWLIAGSLTLWFIAGYLGTLLAPWLIAHSQGAQLIYSVLPHWHLVDSLGSLLAHRVPACILAGSLAPRVTGYLAHAWVSDSLPPPWHLAGSLLPFWVPCWLPGSLPAHRVPGSLLANQFIAAILTPC